MKRNSCARGTIVLLLLLCFACGSSEQQSTQLTYQLRKKAFNHSIQARGELEAKNAISVVTPHLGFRMLLIAWLIPEGTLVKKDDVVAQLESQEIKTDYENALDELEIAKAEYNKREAELTLERVALDAQIKNAEASADVSRLQLAKLKFEPQTRQDIEKLRIEKAEVNVAKNRKKLATLSNIQKEERTRLRLKIQQSQNKLDKSKEYLDKLNLQAPVDGFVIYERSWMTGEKMQEGGSCWPRMPLVKIPDPSIMQVKLQLGESEAQKVDKGQETVVTIFSADTMLFKGKVSRKDRRAKPIRRRSKIKRVEVIVEIDSTNPGLAPGISADCRIHIEKLDSVIAIPYECIFEKDSTKVVYTVSDENVFAAHAIDVTRHTADFAIIHSDLTGSERCALSEPADNKITWPDTLKVPPRKQAPIDSSKIKQEEPKRPPMRPPGSPPGRPQKPN